MIIDLRRALQEAEATFARHCDLLTITQFAVLKACDLNVARSQSQLVTLSGVDRSTIGTVIGRLLERKFIVRHRSAEDARSYDVKLTKAGQKLFDKATVGYEKATEEAFGHVPEKQRKNFVSWLNKMAEKPLPVMAD